MPPPAPPLSADEPGWKDEPEPIGSDAANTEALVGPDDDTAPLPVILPDPPPESESARPRMRDPFEPLERAAPATEGVESDPEPTRADAKMDQIKDLYLTAEALGEENLTTHFEQVSERQRQLIREYFDQVVGQSADGLSSAD